MRTCEVLADSLDFKAPTVGNICTRAKQECLHLNLPKAYDSVSERCIVLISVSELSGTQKECSCVHGITAKCDAEVECSALHL